MTNNVAGIANSNRLQLQFAYDSMGRRIQKIVSIWNSSTLNYQPSTTNRFVYDGWNLLAIINPQSSILQSFMWGQDLSGTMAGGGGVGGLLMASISGTNCLAAYDGNGNITALINTEDKSLMARYEYSPYGELLRATGQFARQNPFRYSTKFLDEESGLIHYGHRFYNPFIGRWINRDSSGEKGGIHLYMFSRNSPIHVFDPNGCDPTSLQTLAVEGPWAEFADEMFTYSSFCLPGGPYSTVQGMGSDMLQAIAIGTCITINDALGGKLLQNIGGDAAFLAYGAAGRAMGAAFYIDCGMDFSQSLACAVVSGRLEALSAIGAGAADVLAGRGPRNGGSDFGANVAQAGYDFARDLQKGDTAYGSLDAALLGAAVNDDNEFGGNIQGACFTFDILNGDAAAAFSDLPEYQGLNAWDMAESLQE
jgi:RHS repeat-associated protein